MSDFRDPGSFHVCKETGLPKAIDIGCWQLESCPQENAQRRAKGIRQINALLAVDGLIEQL